MSVYSSMKPGKRIVWSFYGTLIVYLIMNLFFGEYGVLEKQKLAAYETLLKENIAGLYRTGADLEEHSVALRTDSDMVALLARELGYRRADEVLVRIDGYNNPPDRYTVGKTINRAGTPPSRKQLLRVVTVIAGILIFFGLSLIGKQTNGKKRYG